MKTTEKANRQPPSMLKDRNFIILCCIAFLYALANGAVWFVLPTLLSTIVPDVFAIGMLLILPYLAGLIIAMPAGNLSDYVGRKRVAIFGLILALVAGVMILAINNIIAFVIFALFFGLSQGFINSPARAYIMDIAPKEVSSEYFGTFLAAISLAIAISPLIAGVIISDGMVASLPLLVTVYSILTIVSICLFIVLYEPITKRRSTREGLARIVIEDKLFVSAIKEFKKLRTIGLVIVFLSFFLTLMDGIMWSFEPLYYEELGFDPTTGGLIIFAYLAPLVFCQIPAGYIADRYGKIKPMLVGLALGGASLVLFGLVSDLTSILLTALSSALGLSLAWPAVSGLIIDVSVNRNKGSISGVWNMAMDSASVVAPLLGGIISLMYVGVGGIFVAVGVLSLVMAPILVLLLRRSQAMLQ